MSASPLGALFLAAHVEKVCKRSNEVYDTAKAAANRGKKEMLSVCVFFLRKKGGKKGSAGRLRLVCVFVWLFF
jgi:hypothetical protein